MLGDYGVKRQRVEFVGDVQENDDFETPDWIEQLICFEFKSARVFMMDSTELPSSSTSVFSGMYRSEEPAGTHAKFDQSTGDVSSDRESPFQCEFGECVG